MPLVNSAGIDTTKLCPESKKYLSRLLINTTGIHADFIPWDLILKEKIGLDFYAKGGFEWNELLKEAKLKPTIEKKLAQIEYKHQEQEYLKPYVPEFRKQQAEVRHKKLALLSIAVIIGLAIGFPFALPLLGGAATLVGVVSLATGATLLWCSIIPAFVGEKLIDNEWLAEYHRKKESFSQIYQKIEIEEETIQAEEENTNIKKIPVIKAIAEINTINQPVRLTADVATQTKELKNYNISFFANVTVITDPSQKAKANAVPTHQLVYKN